VADWWAEPDQRRSRGIKAKFTVARSESQLRVFPNEPALSRASVGTPLPDSKADQPPVIRRAEVVALVLVVHHCDFDSLAVTG
jgi:hypothetical protein